MPRISICVSWSELNIFLHSCIHACMRARPRTHAHAHTHTHTHTYTDTTTPHPPRTSAHPHTHPPTQIWVQRVQRLTCTGRLRRRWLEKTGKSTAALVPMSSRHRKQRDHCARQGVEFVFYKVELKQQPLLRCYFK